VNLAALVLAAGSARRFGADKLAAQFRGEPLLTHAIRAARAAPVTRVVVIGQQVDPGDWPGEPAVECLPIASPALSVTLAAGIAAVAQADGAFVFLGDMPLVPPELAAQLADTLGARYAAAPRHHGIPGHPVLFARRAFADLEALTGDAGAGRLLRSRDVLWLDVADEGVVLDIDRPEDIPRLETR
jgi:molybdenum cofactor cytidylyltransferase